MIHPKHFRRRRPRASYHNHGRSAVVLQPPMRLAFLLSAYCALEITFLLRSFSATISTYSWLLRPLHGFSLLGFSPLRVSLPCRLRRFWFMLAFLSPSRAPKPPLCNRVTVVNRIASRMWRHIGPRTDAHGKIGPRTDALGKTGLRTDAHGKVRENPSLGQYGATPGWQYGSLR
jgi:hypothetical protein